MTETRPYCFVAMPFGRKTDATGAPIEFDAVYEGIIEPAVEQAGLQPIRADEERVGGIIHKPMFERLLLCEYAVADLTTANANVFYELGIRHAYRPWSTVLLFAEGSRLPFDVSPSRGLPYRLGATGAPTAAEDDRAALRRALVEARGRATDSPLFQLLDGLEAPALDRISTDVFRERTDQTRAWKQWIATAREAGVEALHAVEQRLGPLGDVEAGVLVELLLAYRSVDDHAAMRKLAARLPEPLRDAPSVQEQLAFALNRDGDHDAAERVLLSLLERRGPSGETYGLLGRVYKDRWEQAVARGERLLAEGLLEKAIETYLRGFESDWRSAYPGVNAATLMALRDPVDPRLERLLPVVAYAVERRLETVEPDYWDHATDLELAVLSDDRAAGARALGRTLVAARETWQTETTARNLRLLRSARERRGTASTWVEEAEAALRECGRANRVASL